MDLKDFAVLSIRKAEEAYDKGNKQEAIRILTLLMQAISDKIVEIG